MDKNNEKLMMMNSILFMRGYGDLQTPIIISNAYLYVCKNKLIENVDSDLIEVANEFNEKTNADIILEINSVLEKMDINQIKELVYDLLSGVYNELRYSYEGSNKGISDLVYDLLKVDSGDMVMDVGSGVGTFLANTYKNAKTNNIILKELIGVEINREAAYLSKMALNILIDRDMACNIMIGNGLEKIKYPYYKGYVFPPLGLRSMLQNENKKSLLFPSVEFNSKNTTEWIFVDRLLEGLAINNSRAVALVSGKALFNNADMEYRNKLIQSGRLEGVIELPIGSLRFTGAKVFMLVFSRNNGSVKFVDASKLISANNKRYINFELPAKQILDMYYGDEVNQKDISNLKDILNLSPSSIMTDVKKIENGIRLGEVADVFTGNQYTLANFEKKGMLTEEKTGYRILTSSDIVDGNVRWDKLQSIKYNDTKFDKFAVHYGDVVVTSKSSKVKTVVVDIEPKEKILVTGAMLIVRPNLEKLNPTYLKMYLDSKNGQDALKLIQKGNIIVTISPSSLSSIEIPSIDIKKQKEKAEKYNNALSTLIAYKEEIKRIENSLNNIFDEEEE